MPFLLSHPKDTAERVEGEPFYELATYTLQDSDSVPPLWHGFAFQVRAFKVLPPSDAVGLLSGDDSTGLVVWSGALALLEWLLRTPERLDSILPATMPGADGKGATHVIELGCGSGIATVGLSAMLQWRLRHPHAAASSKPADLLVSLPHLCATDGNPECVELARRNVHERCGPDGGACTGETATAAVLPWGDDAATRKFLQTCCAGATSGTGGTVVVSADVLYDAAAVPLLVSTVATIAEEVTAAAAHVFPGDSAGRVQWWLAYTPRSLTRAGNERIFRTLVESLDERGWSHEMFSLPAGAVTTGFEDRSDCDTPALRGCILVVRPEAARPSSALCF